MSDDDSLDTWDDRSFLEGFYEVDGTVNDWEREKRVSQVERSLKEIEKRKRKAENLPGVIQSGGQRQKLNSNAVRAPFRRDFTGQRGTFTRLPGNPNAPAQITKLPYYGSRYPAYTNYVNASNKYTTTASKSGDTTRPPTQEELEAAHADMQKGFSGQNALQHINDAAEYVTNAATPQNNTQGKTQTATSLVPGIDTFADAAAIPVDLLRGDYISAGLDTFGVIPVVGEIADTAKLARAGMNVADAAQGANKLNITHRLTKSHKEMEKLINDIKSNGIKETIKYVEHNGEKFVVDGHHRLHIARLSGLKNIPVEKVNLPYKGYNSINDLFWE